MPAPMMVMFVMSEVSPAADIKSEVGLVVMLTDMEM